MIATLSTCAQLERDNISFRLQSGRKQYIEKGGKLGRKVGSVKTEEQMKAEYREVVSLLRNKTIDFTFFSKKGFVNSGLKAKSTTFANNIKIEYNGRKQYNSR